MPVRILSLLLIIAGLSGCLSQKGEPGQTIAEFLVETSGDTETEIQGKHQLEKLLAAYKLDPWVFTQHVIIEDEVIPHSHPVLTLNTSYLDDDTGQLATFLHEQIHWYLDTPEISTEAIMAELRERYPEVPVGKGRGARSEYSTYLHLIVCWLELDALSHFVGERAARQSLSQNRHYRWIYAQVLEETEALGSLIERHQLIIQP